MSRRVSSDAQIWTEVLESDDLHPGDLDRPLLKNIACQKLGVAKVDEIASGVRTPGHMKRTNPKVFTGVSCMPGEYEIKLREGVTPLGYKVRICGEVTELNKAVLRENHPMLTTQQTLTPTKLAGAKIVSKLEANCRFSLRKLSLNSKLLTIFITPWGR